MYSPKGERYCPNGTENRGLQEAVTKRRKNDDIFSIAGIAGFEQNQVRKAVSPTQ